MKESRLTKQENYIGGTVRSSPILPKTTPRTNEPIIAIEILRFMCAIAVMAMHYSYGFWTIPGVQPKILLGGIHYRSSLGFYTQIGWVGVELFFVISGMVIARSAIGAKPADFFRRRFLRLAPAVWICATLTVAVVGAAGGVDLTLGAAWLRSVSFWPLGQQIDGSYWTLGIEIAFYGLVYCILYLRGDTKTNLERLAWGLAITGALFWLYMLGTLPNWAHTDIDRPIQLSLMPHGCFFALGICISEAIANGWNRNRVLLLVVASLPATSEIIIHAFEGTAGTDWPVAALPAWAAVFAGCAILIASPQLQPQLRRVINPRIARSIGAATFPLYLLHQDAGAAITSLLVGAGIATPAVALVTCAALAIVAAWAIARWLEPILRAALETLLKSSAPFFNRLVPRYFR